jgi:hypothetical protein
MPTPRQADDRGWLGSAQTETTERQALLEQALKDPDARSVRRPPRPTNNGVRANEARWSNFGCYGKRGIFERQPDES